LDCILNQRLDVNRFFTVDITITELVADEYDSKGWLKMLYIHLSDVNNIFPRWGLHYTA